MEVVDELSDPSKTLQTGDAPAKVRALSSLAARNKRGPRPSEALLTQVAAQLNDESSAVRDAAVGVLRQWDADTPPTDARLRVALVGARPQARLYAAQGYGRVPAPASAIDQLGKLGRDQSPDTTDLRLAVATALAGCQPDARPGAFVWLAERLDDAAPAVREIARNAMSRDKLTPEQRELLVVRMVAVNYDRRYKTPEARIAAARILKDDPGETPVLLRAFRPLLSANEPAELRACAVDVILDSDAAVRGCVGAGDTGPVLFDLLGSDAAPPIESRPEARRRILSRIAAAAPLALAADRLRVVAAGDPDAAVRGAAEGLLCALPVNSPDDVVCARKLLASSSVGAPEKVLLLSALATASGAAEKVVPEVWPEVWAIVEAQSRRPDAPALLLKALETSGRLIDRRPGGADAGRDRAIADTLAGLAFDLDDGGSGFDPEARAAATRLLRPFAGLAIEVTAARAAKAKLEPACRLYEGVVSLAADGPLRDQAARVIADRALLLAKDQPGLRPTVLAAAGRLGGDRFVDLPLLWSERKNTTTGESHAVELRVWAVEVLGAIDPATLSGGDRGNGKPAADVRTKVLKQLEFLELRGTDPKLRAAAATSLLEFRKRLKK
ncbi:hypothetical protein FRUB_09031 [Fimbriiglobus ruber]|uniref:Uncharacterized protein n=1 Tax=Fimbriiglobus ruber TaxID=1908690 RepID=A0A225DD62_9BACT|nr:hypothetical protein FRUB_09031 [Fimbriiglobus ruber]